MTITRICKDQKLTISKQALSLLFLQRSVPPCQSKFVLNILNFLKLYHCCSLNKFVIYFPELSISTLIVIIQLSSKLAYATSIPTITSRKNLYSCQYLTVFSKYLLIRIRSTLYFLFK